MNDFFVSLKSVLQVMYLLMKKPFVVRQIFNTRSIPIIIVNFNQLYYLRQLIDFLLNRGFNNIIIIDNNSTYPPLLEYYDSILEYVTIERREDNLGHLVFFKDETYLSKYGKGFYVLTDPDIVPNRNLPINFCWNMIKVLFKNYNRVIKVGFALDLESIPDYYPLKSKVLEWEKKYWDVKVSKNAYLAYIDTTFAIYRPGYRHGVEFFYSGIRLAGDYLCKHGGWYLNPDSLTEENRYYMELANESSSWMIDENRVQKFEKNN